MARYIDAEFFKNLTVKLGKKQGRPRFAELLCEYIDCVPTADVVEVRHGEWVEQIRDYGKYLVTEGYKCSICGFELTDNDYKYCHDCGAKMDGERKEQ
jgi:hypothetical protein